MLRAALITLLVLGTAGAGVATPVRAEADSSPLPPKASSLAPRGHTATRTYGAPIQPRILTHVYRKPRRAPGRSAAARA
jgi:hypothetical protein